MWPCLLQLAIVRRQYDHTISERFRNIDHPLVIRSLITSRGCFLIFDEWSIDEDVHILQQCQFFLISNDLLPGVSRIRHDMEVIDFEDDGKICKILCLVKWLTTTEGDVFAYACRYFLQYSKQRQQASSRVVMCLRVVATLAVPAASLQEYSRTQSWTIHDGVLYDTCDPEPEHHPPDK